MFIPHEVTCTPNDRLALLLCLKEVDWEVELAFVIGRKGKHIKVSDGGGVCMCAIHV